LFALLRLYRQLIRQEVDDPKLPCFVYDSVNCVCIPKSLGLRTPIYASTNHGSMVTICIIEDAKRIFITTETENNPHIFIVIRWYEKQRRFICLITTIVETMERLIKPPELFTRSHQREARPTVSHWVSSKTEVFLRTRNESCLYTLPKGGGISQTPVKVGLIPSSVYWIKGEGRE
jgi:hypothetical protein